MQTHMMTSIGNYRVMEGRADEALAGIPDQDAKVLVFISRSRDASERDRQFATLRRASLYIDSLIRKREERRFDALVDALTPDIKI